MEACKSKGTGQDRQLAKEGVVGHGHGCAWRESSEWTGEGVGDLGRHLHQPPNEQPKQQGRVENGCMLA
jgi:hypothetical protein